jgi:uncharacterized membrane protein
MKSTILLVSGIIGFYISLYFTLVSRKIVRPETSMVPAFCRLDGDSCDLVIQHPHARLLGPSNFSLGLFYYAIIILLAVSEPTRAISSFFVLISWFTVALAIFLVHSLYAKVKVRCTLCMIAHAVNILIAYALTAL